MGLVTAESTKSDRHATNPLKTFTAYVQHHGPRSSRKWHVAAMSKAAKVSAQIGGRLQHVYTSNCNWFLPLLRHNLYQKLAIEFRFFELGPGSNTSIHKINNSYFPNVVLYRFIGAINLKFFRKCQEYDMENIWQWYMSHRVGVTIRVVVALWSSLNRKRLTHGCIRPEASRRAQVETIKVMKDEYHIRPHEWMSTCW